MSSLLTELQPKYAPVNSITDLHNGSLPIQHQAIIYINVYQLLKRWH